MFDGIVGSEHARQLDDHWIVTPADVAECAATLRLCGERKLAVVPSGGETKMRWGNPVHPNVVIETRRTAGVREHSWQDLTATVGAGTVWDSMQQALAQHGQMVALDPLWPERATVGGIVATNDSGALRLRYGSLRDLIIGMTVVLADGTIARSGGKVVKNVAGYDLHKLMTGAFGTLGIVTEVTFRLHPVERSVETWTVRAPNTEPDTEALGAVMLRVLDSTVAPASMQMRSNADGFSLDVRFVSRLEVLATCAARLREMAIGLECVRADNNVWQSRERIFNQDDAFVLKTTTLPAKMAALVAQLAQSGVKKECVADAAGICTVALQGEETKVMHALENLRSQLAASGGSVVVLQAPKHAAEALVGTINRWGNPPAAVAVMREIKQQFDPGRTLNPGRFVGGI